MMILWGGLVACSQPAPTSIPPTLQPTAALPTATSEQTNSVPATNTAVPPTPTAEAEVEETESATPLPPAEDAPEPTEAPPRVDPEINLTTPSTDAFYVLGQPLTVSGRIKMNADETAEVALITLNGQTLTGSLIEPSELGTWEVELMIPDFSAGVVNVLATIFNEAGQGIAQDSVPINLEANREDTRYLDLFRPHGYSDTTAGYNIFFDGYVENPSNNLITISILAEDCQTAVSKQSFVLNGSGYWQGFVVTPSTVSGLGCATAYFGDVGSENRRETIIPLNILANSDPDAYGVHIGNPPAGSSFEAGGQIFIYGTAHKAPNSEVTVSVLLEDGTVIASEVATADTFGYWEVPLQLPAALTGMAELFATIGTTEEAVAQHSILINIEEVSE